MKKTYGALVTLRVKTEVRHDNPAYMDGIATAIEKGDYDFVEIAKPFKGEEPCSQHGEPK